MDTGFGERGCRSMSGWWGGGRLAIVLRGGFRLTERTQDSMSRASPLQIDLPWGLRIREFRAGGGVGIIFHFILIFPIQSTISNHSEKK